MFAVTVTFTLVSGRAAEFLPLMRDNAATSLQDEDGCQRFDICTDPAQPDAVFLYELYTDKAAFQAHLQTAHFIAFDAATAAMIADKTVATYQEVWP